MKEQKWGRIINTTSKGRLGSLHNSNYAAAKGGVVGLTKGVAKDLSSYGITCNAYGPGAATRLTLSEDTKTRAKKQLESGFISKEFFDIVMNPPPPETIPPLLIYLCTDEASDLNGLVFDVFGQEIFIYSEEVKNSIKKEKDLWTIEELIELVPKVLLKGIDTMNR
jgi:NAD(P)-dependent dehydrogenase (short-subunit alcohol dehydrogenase family)